MAWIQPKTDWVASDYFNAEDYNRIIGNITYLKAYLATLFRDVDTSSMGEEKTYLSLIYAREVNNIETQINKLNLISYVLNIGETKTYRANGKTPTYEDFNRIESAIFNLYKMATAHKESLPKLEITLGQKGIRV